MNQLIISVVVAVALTAVAAVVLRSHAPSTGHTGGVMSSKAPDFCRRQEMLTEEYEDISLDHSSKD
jgi:hypothetical protein